MRRLATILVLLISAGPVHPCTTFCLARDGEALFGRNYDFEIGQGYVMTNHRGVVKTSMAGTLTWTAKYGSVTFNQWGREFPMDGMNEAGLVIALMWLDETEYPRDDRPALRVLEWIQYGLDNFGSVTELLARIEETRIAGGTPLHYLVADATGDAATIEYLEGRLVVHRGSALPTAVLANDSYSRSIGHLQQLSGRRPSSSSSLDRFARASSMLRTTPATVNGAFEVLDSVAQRGWTRWSVVYDAKRREIWWISDRNGTRKHVGLADLPFECSAGGKMLDIHAPAVAFESYSPEKNRELVVSSYAATSFTRNQPVRSAHQDAAHAESFQCGAPRRSVQARPPVVVTLVTSAGEIDVELFTEKAPLSSADFLRYVDRGMFDGAAFYRVVNAANDRGTPKIEVIQGGLLDESRALPPVAHETTEQTGIRHVDGTVSLARAEVGTGTASAFFICIGDQPALDYGGMRNPDGQGFAAFGRVIRGMEVVRKIQTLPAGGASESEYMRGQMLTTPVVITKAILNP